MKVCLISHFKTSFIVGDIGTKLVAHNLSREISKFCEVELIDIKDVYSWIIIQKMNPQIIHFILAPTLIGLLITKIFGLIFRNSKIIVSAPNPSVKFSKKFLRNMKPDLMLVQSYYSENLFRNLDFKTTFLPNGVDIERFIPHSEDSKKILREKYGIDKTKFIILHVGPIINGRNIQALENLQGTDNQVIIVGRANADGALLSSLESRGFIIMTQHINHIEEIYALSDCYVFPTNPNDRGKSIEAPLSVLEAMSCDLPVITTRYGALLRMFNNSGEGLFFVSDEKDIIDYINLIKRNKISIKTRKRVAPYSWEAIRNRLLSIYSNCLKTDSV